MLERRIKQQQMLLSVQLPMTVLKHQPKRKLRLPLLSSLLKIASENIAMIKQKYAEKTLLALELSKIVNMSAMTTKLAGQTVLQRKEIPQQVHSGNVSSIMTVLTRLNLEILMIVLKRIVLINGMLVKKIQNVFQISMIVTKDVVINNLVGKFAFQVKKIKLQLMS